MILRSKIAVANWKNNRVLSGRSSMGVGGSGRGSSSGTGGVITRPTRREKEYMAHKVIYLRKSNQEETDLIIEVGKDRNGNTGIKELPEAIEAIADLLSLYKFQGSNTMFQKSLSLRLAEVMKEVLIGDDYVPTSKAVKEYVEGG